MDERKKIPTEQVNAALKESVSGRIDRMMAAQETLISWATLPDHAFESPEVLAAIKHAASQLRPISD